MIREEVPAMSGDHASSDARDLYFEEKGSGPSILLIHPSGATASTWGTFAEELAQRARVIAYDRRGYHRSGGASPHSIAQHTADAAALVETLQAAPVVAVGTSVGATIAIDLARLRPDLVHAVVAHESPWHVTRHRPTLRQIRALSRMSWLASRGRHPEAAAAFLRFAYTYRDGGSAWDQFPDYWRQAVSENAEAALTDIRIAIGSYPSRQQLAAIDRPVTCTCGERSAKTIVQVTRSLAKAIPTATFAQIEGAGHAAPFDAPSNFASVVLDALAASKPK
jgi:pimeloyl-ACP methyl ester carboxylesterase